mgnify:CR=1 FL=1
MVAHQASVAATVLLSKLRDTVGTDYYTSWLSFCRLAERHLKFCDSRGELPPVGFVSCGWVITVQHMLSSCMGCLLRFCDHE